MNVIVRELEDRRGIPKGRRLEAGARNEITILVFVATLRNFLREGSRAANDAAIKVVELGLSGYSIGERVFSPGNENAMRGADLADALWGRIEDVRIRNLLDSENSISWLIEELYAIAKRPDRLDRYRETSRRPG